RRRVGTLFRQRRFRLHLRTGINFPPSQISGFIPENFCQPCPGPVRPDKAVDVSPLDGEGQGAELKARICFAHLVEYHDLFHDLSPFSDHCSSYRRVSISFSSSREISSALLSATISTSHSSIHFSRFSRRNVRFCPATKEPLPTTEVIRPSFSSSS